jgi:hypothetical protein
VQRLSAQLSTIPKLLSSERRYDLGIEDRMTLAFDTFLLRVRVESYLYNAVPPGSSPATSVCCPWSRRPSSPPRSWPGWWASPRRP